MSVNCCPRSWPIPLPGPPPGGGQVRRLTRRLASMFAPAIVVIALGCREDAESPTAPEPGPALTTMSASTLSFRQVSTGGGAHTCGVTTSNVAYCWGRNSDGQLGDGTTTDHLRPVRVTGGLQ